MRDQAGQWQDIDVTLAAKGNGTVGPKAAPAGVAFAGTSGPMATIGTGTTTFSLGWLSKLPAPTLSGNVATYSNVAPNIDLRLTATRLGYSQEFVVKARPTSPLPTFRMPITAEGLDITELPGGELQLKDRDGKLLAQSTQPTMWGAARDPRTDLPLRSAPLDVAVTEGPSGKVLEVSADYAFLSDPTVTYPLIVDPAPTLYAQTDTWIQSNITTTSQYGSVELKAGTYNGSVVARSYAKWDVSQTAGKVVNSATMKLWNNHSYGCGSTYEHSINVVRNDSAFGPSSVWGAGTAPGGTGATITSQPFNFGYGACADNWAYVNVKPFADLWAAGTVNHGVRVTSSESNMNAWKTFASGDAGGATVPQLVVNYSDANVAPSTPTSPAVEGQESLSKNTGNNSPNPTPRLSAIAADPDGGTLTARFYVKSLGAGTWNIIGGTADVVTSGQRAYLTMPLDKLTIGQTFEWTVQTTDSAGSMSPALPLQTTTISPAIMNGKPRGSSIGFSLSDRINASIDTATGNLLVTTSELTVPGATSDTVLGAAYNSRIMAPGSRYTNGQSSHGVGWRQRGGRDIILTASDQGSYIYLGPDGSQGRFTPKAGSSTDFDAPPHIKADLKLVSGKFELTDHATNSKLLFNTAGFLTQIKDRNDNITTWTVDASNRVTYVSGTRGTAQARVFGASLIPAGQPGAGLLAGYLQNVGNGSTAQTRTVAYGYDSSNRLATITDAEGRVTTFGYDPTYGVLNKITTAGGNSVTDIEYDSAARVTKLTRQNDATGSEPWLQDSVTRLAYPAAQTVQVASPLTDQAQPVGSVPVTTYTLDAAKRITKVVDPAGHKRDKTYTQFGDTATESSTDSGGTDVSTTSNTYGANAGESKTQSLGPLGSTNSASYSNPAGAGTPFQPSSTTDSQGNTTAISYNSTGNQITTTDGSTAKAEVDYNIDGTIKNATDPNNVATANRTTYAYYGDTDADGKPDRQIQSITAPTGNTLGVRTATYDDFGRLKTSTTGRSVTTTYTYDKLDRVTQATFSGGTPAVTYSYTPAGDLLQSVDGSGTTSNTYDRDRRLLTRTATSGGGTLTYTYDAAGNLASTTDGGGTISYAHDIRNRMAGMTVPNGTGGVRYHLFFYDKDGRRTNSFYNTVGTGSLASINSFSAWLETQYDKAGRVKRVRMVKNSDRSAAAANVVTDVSYCYDKTVTSTTAACPGYSSANDTDMRSGVTDNKTGTFTSYDYNPAGRLTTVNTGGGAVDYGYGYDASGNRTTVTENGTVTQAFSFNSANQISSGGWTYDAAGNLTVSPFTGTKVYNNTDQTVSVDPPGATPAQTNTWVGVDQSERLTAGANSFVNGQLGVQSYTGPAGAFHVERDSTGAPVAARAGTTEHYYGLDGLGSVTSMVDSSSVTAAATTATYTYDPYGRELSASGPAAIVNRIGYAGGLNDRETGLVKLGIRLYDPSTGRWTQQDSLEFLTNPAEGNRYAYAAGAPSTYTDPTGRSIWDEALDVLDDTATGVGRGGVLGGTTGCVGGALVGGFASGGVGAGPGCVAGGGAGAAIGGVIGGIAGGVSSFFD